MTSPCWASVALDLGHHRHDRLRFDAAVLPGQERRAGRRYETGKKITTRVNKLVKSFFCSSVLFLSAG